MDRFLWLEHGVKAVVWRLFAPALRRAKGPFAPLDGSKLQKVLFLRPDKIGDIVVSLPVFDALKRRYPNIRISILGSPRNYALIKDDPRFDRIFLYTKTAGKDIATVRAIRREKYDCVVDMIRDDSVTALFLSQLCAAGKPRIGIGKSKYRKYYDCNCGNGAGEPGHIIEGTANLLEAFGIDPKSIEWNAPPFIDDESKHAAREFVRSLGRDGTRPTCIGYNLSAGSWTRIWAMDKSIALLRRIQGAYPDIALVLITVAPDRQRATDLARTVGGKVHLSPAGQSLVEASALISQLNVLISPDTSLIHIARAFRVPVVGLYSRAPKNFRLWRPYRQEVGAVVSGDDDNIFDITVDQVFETFRKVMANQGVTR